LVGWGLKFNFSVYLLNSLLFRLDFMGVFLIFEAVLGILFDSDMPALCMKLYMAVLAV
jgi:hypothetical protein